MNVRIKPTDGAPWWGEVGEGRGDLGLDPSQLQFDALVSRSVSITQVHLERDEACLIRLTFAPDGTHPLGALFWVR